GEGDSGARRDTMAEKNGGGGGGRAGPVSAGGGGAVAALRGPGAAGGAGRAASEQGSAPRPPLNFVYCCFFILKLKRKIKLERQGTKKGRKERKKERKRKKVGKKSFWVVYLLYSSSEQRLSAVAGLFSHLGTLHTRYSFPGLSSV
ncbi:unnamed protein product, partial [Coccothraustes coccothraustes]